MMRALILTAAGLVLAPLLLVAAEGDVQNLDAQVLTSRSVRLSWKLDSGGGGTLPAPDGSGGKVTPAGLEGVSFRIGYATVPITEGNWAEPLIVTRVIVDGLEPNGDLYSHVLSGLNPANADTPYYFGVECLDEGIPVGLMGKTSELVPGDSQGPQAPTLLGATPAGVTIDLSWNAPADDLPAERVVSYRVKYSLAEITDATFDAQLDAPGILPAPLDPGSTQWMPVAGLTPGVTYWFAVAGIDERNNRGTIATVQGGLDGGDDGDGNDDPGSPRDDGNSGVCGSTASTPASAGLLLLLTAVLLVRSSIVDRRS